MEANKRAIYEVIPKMSDKIKDSILKATNKAVNEGIQQLKTEVEKLLVEKLKMLNEEIN